MNADLCFLLEPVELFSNWTMVEKVYAPLEMLEEDERKYALPVPELSCEILMKMQRLYWIAISRLLSFFQNSTPEGALI